MNTPEELQDRMYKAAMSCIMRGQYGDREKHKRLEILSQQRPDIIQGEIAHLQRQIAMLREYLPVEKPAHD